MFLRNVLDTKPSLSQNLRELCRAWCQVCNPEDINNPTKVNEIIICMIKYHNIKLYINATAVGREGEGGEECDINFQVTEEE